MFTTGVGDRVLQNQIDLFVNPFELPEVADTKDGVVDLVEFSMRACVVSQVSIARAHHGDEACEVRVEQGERSTEFGAVEERYRLSRELHDTLGQGLAAVLLQLETLDARIQSGADAGTLKTSVTNAMDLTRRNLEEARRSVLDLRAAPLEGKTLSGALTALAETSSDHHLAVRYEAKGGGRPLPGHIEAALYRIASEAVTNIARHADASLASIRLLTTPDEIHLNIEDDGCGFDPDAIPDGHYGLTGLNERVRLLHGDCQIESAPGEGTRLAVIIPIGNLNG